MRVSTVGLGTVGMALSQRLLRAGYEVAGWHQDPRRVHAFVDMGGTPVAGVVELAAVADVCFWALPSVAAERAATDEMLRSNRLPAVIAELSTLPIDAKIETRDRFAGMGTIVLDCAISGQVPRSRPVMPLCMRAETERHWLARRLTCDVLHKASSMLATSVVDHR
jgi:3-hydroxyisobutyrate dehydrogenase-like beta-hydroxyacid dehydrogenase